MNYKNLFFKRRKSPNIGIYIFFHFHANILFCKSILCEKISTKSRGPWGHVLEAGLWENCFFTYIFFSSKDYKVTNTAQIIESQKTVLNFKQTTKNRPLGTKWSTLVENTKGIIISNLITILYLKNTCWK